MGQHVLNLPRNREKYWQYPLDNKKYIGVSNSEGGEKICRNGKHSKYLGSVTVAFPCEQVTCVTVLMWQPGNKRQEVGEANHINNHINCLGVFLRHKIILITPACTF